MACMHVIILYSILSVCLQERALGPSVDRPPPAAAAATAAVLLDASGPPPHNDRRLQSDPRDSFHPPNSEWSIDVPPDNFSHQPTRPESYNHPPRPAQAHGGGAQWEGGRSFHEWASEGRPTCSQHEGQYSRAWDTPSPPPAQGSWGEGPTAEDFDLEPGRGSPPGDRGRSRCDAEYYYQAPGDWEDDWSRRDSDERHRVDFDGQDRSGGYRLERHPFPDDFESGDPDVCFPHRPPSPPRMLHQSRSFGELIPLYVVVQLFVCISDAAATILCSYYCFQRAVPHMGSA